MAKRVSSTSVNWSLIFETLTSVDKATVSPLKVSAEKYLREISSKPVDLPKIDWEFYRNKISIPGMVDSFQKSYETMKVPYPSDQGMLAKVEAANVKMIKHADNMYADVVKEKEELKKKLNELESVMKYSDTTIEELYLIRPEFRIDPDNPKIWQPIYNLKGSVKKQEH